MKVLHYSGLKSVMWPKYAMEQYSISTWDWRIYHDLALQNLDGRTVMIHLEKFYFVMIYMYLIAGNFRGRKLSQIGEKYKFCIAECSLVQLQ